MDKQCNEMTLQQVCQFLKKHDRYIILTHISPDGDTLGSAYALALGLESIGKKAYVVCNDEIPRKYDYFVKAAALKPIDYKTIVAVDVADASLLGPLLDEYSDKIQLNIDHHISNKRYAKNLYLDAEASATAECIFDIFKKMHIKITPIIASALYTGISTDTGCFKYSNVTSKTHRIAASLYECGIDAAEINHMMFDTKSKNRLSLEKMVLESAEYYFNDKCIVLTVTTQMQKESGCEKSDLEGVAVISRSVEGILAGVSIKQTSEDKYKISLRTYPPLDASNICSQFGGGGHRNAAGCVLTGSLDEVKAQITGAIKKALEDAHAGTDSAE